jgi:hypothetical protein
MVVVREDDQIKANVAQQFFNQTFGVLDSDSRNHTAERVLNAFLAISSLGNVCCSLHTLLCGSPANSALAAPKLQTTRETLSQPFISAVEHT